MIDDFAEFTNVALAVVGLLLLASALVSRVGSRFGIPVNLLFLIVGMLAGSDGVGGIWFDRFDVAYFAGTAALVVILFAGGLNTSFASVRRALAPAVVLATLGVFGIAGLTAVGAHYLGMTWPEALLVGAIVSSTDAAAVFAVLDGVPLRRRVAHVVELESGLNDPVAVILTTAAALNLMGTATIDWYLAVDASVQLAVGAAVGIAVGLVGRWLLPRVQLSTPALFPAVTLALALLAFGVSAQLWGSGFLAVYLTGIVIGNSNVPYRVNLERFHESFAWLAQVGMFLILGLLVFPSQLVPVAGTGLALALFLAIVARPVVVTLCLLPFGFEWREIACVAWLGLRGAVPIILAAMPVLMEGSVSSPSHELLDEFDVVFFVVVVGSFLPGMTVRYLPHLLGLEEVLPPLPHAAIDISSSVPMQETQLNVFIDGQSPAVGRTLAELALPSEAAVMLVVRGDRLLAPRGETRFEPGDHAFVLCTPECVAVVRAHFESGD